MDYDTCFYSIYCVLYYLADVSSQGGSIVLSSKQPLRRSTRNKSTSHEQAMLVWIQVPTILLLTNRTEPGSIKPNIYFNVIILTYDMSYDTQNFHSLCIIFY